MTLLKTAVDEKLYDTRVMERGLAKGQRTAEELEKHASKLPDDAALSTTLNIDELVESIKGKSSLRKTI